MDPGILDMPCSWFGSANEDSNSVEGFTVSTRFCIILGKADMTKAIPGKSETDPLVKWIKPNEV